MKIQALGYAVVTACMMLIASVESGYARDSSLAQRIDAEQLSNRASVSTNPLLKQSELTEIIDIQVLDADDGGSTIVLTTPSEEISQPFTIINGDTFTAEIENAVLSLPLGGDFRLETPADGFESVEVTQLSPDQVEVRVVSSAEILDSSVALDQQGQY